MGPILGINLGDIGKIYRVLPGHATVNGKVEWIGETDNDVDEEDYVVHQLVVQELHKAGKKV